MKADTLLAALRAAVREIDSLDDLAARVRLNRLIAEIERTER